MTKANTDDKEKQLSSLSIGDFSFTVQGVGIRGLGAYDYRKKYAIVLTPSLDASSPTGIKIPITQPEALTELRNMLPKTYLNSLRLIGSAESARCESGNVELDEVVISALQYYWMLRNKENPLLSGLGHLPGGENRSYAAAVILLSSICTERRPPSFE